MGTLVVSTCVKALSGTWPPFGNAAADPIGVPLKALPRGPGDELFNEGAAAVMPVAVNDELVGPVESPADEPPATKPADAPVRTNRLRRSEGFFWNPGSTSSTT